MSHFSVCLLSGKGGSGKTVLSLSIAKILTEAGVRVLLVDGDASTHGATYFFEREITPRSNALTLADLAGEQLSPSRTILGASAGFDFVPSVLSPTDSSAVELLTSSEGVAKAGARIASIASRYDVVIYDCQAGYSILAAELSRRSQRNIVVLEADAVSAAALRVLYLQLGRQLPANATWQLFNKLTEEERPLYERVAASTFYPSLPPIPFDWQVRAAFAVGEVPALTQRSSAFGLAVLRLLRKVLPELSDDLARLEQATVGDWFTDISERLMTLEERRRDLKYEVIEKARQSRLQRARVTSILGGGLAVIVIVLSTAVAVGVVPVSFEFISTIVVSSGAIVASLLYYRNTALETRIEYEQDRAQQAITEIEDEMKKYRTLILTDPALRELMRNQNDALAHEAGA